MKEILFLLDEAGQIGHMPAIDQGLTLLRSYGLRMAFFFQSIGQLHEMFRGKESVLVDNTEQIYFGVNSWETADRVSKQLGSATIVVESASENSSWNRQADQPGASTGYSFTRNMQEYGRALLMPDEVLQLSGEYLIAFLRNMPPIRCRRVKWWELTGSRFRRSPLLWWALAAVVIVAMAWAMTWR
jgi:type IV secretion system protein VirD4